jgi:hypothetical protein
MITGGSSVDFETKRQKRDHYRSVKPCHPHRPSGTNEVVTCATNFRRQRC